jgi:hypothetical protein
VLADATIEAELVGNRAVGLAHLFAWSLTTGSFPGRGTA